jgi:hypothetical protein
LSRFPYVSVLLLLVAWSGRASGDPRDFTRVRSTERPMIELLQAGAARSPTFRRLIETLERSDVIVYVERSRKIDGGYLRFATVAGHSRWVQVTVNPDRPVNQVLAMIGHELQHAIEISEAPSVVDETTMAGLYRRIGVQSCRHDARACYETREAQVAGANIFRELSGRSIPPDGLACALRE